MDSHRRPVCADGHTQTATDVMCVLTDSHIRLVCAGGHPRTSCVYITDSPRGPKSPKQSTGRASVLSPRTSVLICVLMDSQRRPMDSHERHVCADGHTQTHTDSHGRPVCAEGNTRTQPTWAKITRTVHGKGQRAESKDQGAESKDQPTNVLCVLTDTHGHRQTATDVMCVLTGTHGHTRTATDVLCVLADSHGHPVCTEQTAHVGQNHPNSPREGPAC
ncbi:unnamed protein product [Brassica rapa]|uniref:Uncharacterized protein n=1 Tax=Brassica campestris TaxID=3711 RepID=A0A8D9FZG6_BRACM|nr:unnamed protein product [Brassica rapa]